uniref:Uncharacterized protein n=1 Tax=Caenorhabditis japonica TaxID=281687 RepID=A0A8R1ICP3_CAEJA
MSPRLVHNNQMTLMKNYHTASTHPQSTMPPKEDTLRRNASLYGVEGY